MKSRAGLSARKRLSIPVGRSSILALCIGFAMTGALVPLAYAEDMPTPEEMQEMQKAMQEGMGEMQKAMDALDPETRKQVEQLISFPMKHYQPAETYGNHSKS